MSNPSKQTNLSAMQAAFIEAQAAEMTALLQDRGHLHPYCNPESLKAYFAGVLTATSNVAISGYQLKVQLIKEMEK